MPESNICCTCVEKRTLCLIIGYIELVCEVIAGILVVYLVAGGYWLGSDLAVEVVLLVYVTLLLTATISLLVGVYKNKRELLKAYLLFWSVNFVIQVAIGIYFLVLNMSDFMGVSSAVFVRIYIMIAVHDYYGTMATVATAPTPRTPLLA